MKGKQQAVSLDMGEDFAGWYATRQWSSLPLFILQAHQKLGGFVSFEW